MGVMLIISLLIGFVLCFCLIKRKDDTITNWKEVPSDMKDRKKMFLVKAVNVNIGGAPLYTTDVHCVWVENGSFKRWPHSFRPTHYCEIPE